MKKNLFWLFLLFMFCACTDDNNEGNGGDDNLVNYTVNGKVEKGPFLKGATVMLQPLDGKLNQIGSVFSTTIKDDEGNFDFGSLELTSPYALLTTNGFFYNEVEGTKSDAPITLQTIVDLSDYSTVNVNILTHLKKDRLKKLVSDGMSYLDANKQAQTELLTNFGLQKYADTDVSKFTITSGTNEAAALIIVSSALLDDNSEAELAEVLTDMSQELTSSGKLSDKAMEAYRVKAIKLKDRYFRIQENIVDRYKEFGKEVSVKDLSRFVDWDNDGIAGNEFGDSDEPVKIKFEKEELVVPTEGGVFSIKIESNAPYTFTKPGPKDDYITSEGFVIINSDTIAYTKKVENDVLVLTVNPASAMIMENMTIKLYSYDGKVHSTLTIKQEGDDSKIESLFTDNGKSLLGRILGGMRDSKSYTYTMEALYTKLYTTSDYSMKNFVTPPVSMHNSTLYKGWSNAYSALRGVRTLKDHLSSHAGLLSYATCWEAMIYYDLAVLWENVPYVEGNDIYANVVQYPSEQLFAMFETVLKNGIDNFTDKKSTFKTNEDYFFMSKDVARLVLAKMYLYQKEYAKAAPLFEAIVQGNHYKEDNSRAQSVSSNSQELIWGVLVDSPDNVFKEFIENGDTYLPTGTYTEVLLSIAECAYKMNDQNKAKNYLDKVIAARGLSAASGDFMTSLKTVWKSELKASYSYFAFLKRNGLAISELSLKEYQLLFPIPENDVILSPTINQNPGYLNN